jgi:hypothetical protein
VSYATGKESQRIKVGWFPQRSRRGRIPSTVVPRLSPESTPDGGAPAPEGGTTPEAGAEGGTDAGGGG